ncbi:MAG: hypothetical protein SFY66_06080 [Oculatellaceae cyanobacterium bins.114]|nr:hypothetical protein [Oculatellaceae cyanobacterium bins.114]
MWLTVSDRAVIPRIAIAYTYNDPCSNSEAAYLTTVETETTLFSKLEKGRLPVKSGGIGVRGINFLSHALPHYP